MKLTSEQVTRTTDQFEIQALPDSHPSVPELKARFGDHTFLVDIRGLNILEPSDEAPEGVAVVVNLANWSDGTLTRLVPHEPTPTGDIVELVATH